MGLSTKQVSSDGLDWSQSLLQAQTLELPKPAPARRQQQQNQQQQPEPLKCPRCDSTNTKFCYYNNYNKSQPRHFCRACKRHWTKGGTLRNVPVGGGRKNKRQKKPAASASASTSTSTSTGNGNSPSASAAVASTTNSNISNRLNNMAIQAQQQRQNLPVSLGEQRCVPEFLYQSLLRPPSAMTHKNFLNSGNLDSRTFGSNNRISSLPFPLDQNLQVPFSTSSPFNTNPFSASASLPPPNGYNYSEEFKTMEEPTITGILANPSSTTTQPWQIPATTTGMDTNTYWSWDEIDTFASTDLNLPWDDSETKP